ncbi:MAG: hypothetical protein AAF928_13645 [Myxococcota bacterium]
MLPAAHLRLARHIVTWGGVLAMFSWLGGACSLPPATSDDSGEGEGALCRDTCLEAAGTGCLEPDFECAVACEQQARLACDDEAETLYACAVVEGCTEINTTCSSEAAALTACREGAAPPDCVADCLDAQARGCSLVGTSTCNALCSNAIAAGCDTETRVVLRCVVEALDDGAACSGIRLPSDCDDELAATEAACEPLLN